MRIWAFVLIIALSLALAFGLDALFGTAEKSLYPIEYSEYVEKYSEEYNIPEYIIYAVIKVESDFDPTAKSSDGAMGLMQMIPSTFEWLTGENHLNEGLSEDALYIPDVSIRYGTYYLRYLYRKFDYNWDTALAAYNAGEGNVDDWLSDSEYSDGNGNLTKIPFKETRSYVKKVNFAIEEYKKIIYEENESETAKA